jgi:hypothetical protein
LKAAFSAPRNSLVDLVRGLGLWILLIDHIQPDVLSRITPGQFGFSDFAEIFIFLSGFINAGMYERALRSDGMRWAIQKLWSRVGRLYIAHMTTMLVCFGLLAAAASAKIYLPEPALYAWMSTPASYVVKTVLLLYNPFMFSLLPLYIVIAPFMLLSTVALRRAPGITLGVSAAIWCVAQSRFLDLAAAAQLEGWYFHPLGWQFLFVLGAATQMYWTRVRDAACSPPALWAAGLIVAGTFALKTLIRIEPLRRHAVGLAPIVARLMAQGAGKGHLAPFRLLHFLALSALIVAIPWNRKALVHSRLGAAAIAAGRHSLPVFSVSLALAIGANLVLEYSHGGWMTQIVLATGCLLAMTGVAYALDRRGVSDSLDHKRKSLENDQRR